MLEPLECPDGVLGFKAVGKIERSDYETVLEPAVKAMLGRRDGLRLVYVLGEEFDGYSASAAVEDAKLGLGNFTKWERIALVTDHDWLSRALAMLGWMMPGEVKTFPVTELEDAITWAAAGAAS
jgi:hypothetical protein